MWRFTSIEDSRRLAQATFISMLLTIVTVLFLYRFVGYPRSVFLVDALLTFLLTAGLRLGIRYYYSHKGNFTGKPDFGSNTFKKLTNKDRKSILIIGAGGSGEKMLREIFDNSQLHYNILGFLDDDPGKKGRTVHGIPVLGSVDKLPDLVQRYDVHQVFISVPSATGAEVRRIVEICKNSQVSYKILPAIGEIMNGKVSIKNLRDVNYEDLLRRPPVHLDCFGIQGYLKAKTILVTGAGGSIGSELVRQIVLFKPRNLILVDSCEANLYAIQMELKHEMKFDDVNCVLGRVQHRTLLEDVFSTYRPHVVFHAAACKHVPMLELNPWEAVYNNIMGSQTVMEMADKYDVERFVLSPRIKPCDRPTSWEPANGWPSLFCSPSRGKRRNLWPCVSVMS